MRPEVVRVFMQSSKVIQKHMAKPTPLDDMREVRNSVTETIRNGNFILSMTLTLHDMVMTSQFGMRDLEKIETAVADLFRVAYGFFSDAERCMSSAVWQSGWKHYDGGRIEMIQGICKLIERQLKEIDSALVSGSVLDIDSITS